MAESGSRCGAWGRCFSLPLTRGVSTSLAVVSVSYLTCRGDLLESPCIPATPTSRPEVSSRRRWIHFAFNHQPFVQSISGQEGGRPLTAVSAGFSTCPQGSPRLPDPLWSLELGGQVETETSEGCNMAWPLLSPGQPCVGDLLLLLLLPRPVSCLPHPLAFYRRSGCCWGSLVAVMSWRCVSCVCVCVLGVIPVCSKIIHVHDFFYSFLLPNRSCQSVVA